MLFLLVGILLADVDVIVHPDADIRFESGCTDSSCVVEGSKNPKTTDCQRRYPMA